MDGFLDDYDSGMDFGMGWILERVAIMGGWMGMDGNGLDLG